MPESPLVQKETVALTDLETLVAARFKGETETELGFRKRIEREEAEYKAAARQLAGKFKVDSESLDAEYTRRNEVLQTFQRTDQAVKDEYAQTKKQIDEQFKKDQRGPRKPRKKRAGRRWRSLRARKTRGPSGARGVEANWAAAKEDLHIKQDDAEIVLKRCGKLADASLPVAEPTAVEATAPIPAETSGSPETAQSPDTVDKGKTIDDESPPPSDPLQSLQALTTRIEEEVIALAALKLPKFLRPDVFVWPFLLLGGRCNRRARVRN